MVRTKFQAKDHHEKQNYRYYVVGGFEKTVVNSLSTMTSSTRIICINSHKCDSATVVVWLLYVVALDK